VPRIPPLPLQTMSLVKMSKTYAEHIQASSPSGGVFAGSLDRPDPPPSLATDPFAESPTPPLPSAAARFRATTSAANPPLALAPATPEPVVQASNSPSPPPPPPPPPKPLSLSVPTGSKLSAAAEAPDSTGSVPGPNPDPGLVKHTTMAALRAVEAAPSLREGAGPGPAGSEGSTPSPALQAEPLPRAPV
jgi:hypothetical protein